MLSTELFLSLTLAHLLVLSLDFFTRFSNDCQVKTIHGFLREAPNEIENFKKEAKIACQLQHPNLVQTFGVCTDTVQDELFLCMSLEACSLKEVCTKMHNDGNFFTASELVKILLDIAYGLHYLHLNSIIHRDLNLGNFLVSKVRTFYS